MKPSGRLRASMIDGVNGSDCIANIFKNKFEKVYNSNITDISELQSLEKDIEQHIMFCSSPTDYVITVKQVNDGVLPRVNLMVTLVCLQIIL